MLGCQPENGGRGNGRKWTWAGGTGAGWKHRSIPWVILGRVDHEIVAQAADFELGIPGGESIMADGGHHLSLTPLPLPLSRFHSLAISTKTSTKYNRRKRVRARIKAKIAAVEEKDDPVR